MFCINNGNEYKKLLLLYVYMATTNVWQQIAIDILHVYVCIIIFIPRSRSIFS